MARVDFPFSATVTDTGNVTVSWVSGLVEKADKVPDFTLAGDAFIARYGRPWPHNPLMVRPDGVHMDCAIYRSLMNGGGHTVCRLCGTGEHCPHTGVLFTASSSPPQPARAPSPPDPHIAALHDIASALREVAAAIRAGHDDAPDDLK